MVEKFEEYMSDYPTLVFKDRNQGPFELLLNEQLSNFHKIHEQEATRLFAPRSKNVFFRLEYPASKQTPVDFTPVQSFMLKQWILAHAGNRNCKQPKIDYRKPVQV